MPLSSPRVSVVTIFLNAERFLEEAIESIRSQTYPHWKLVLVDDGSTDGSSAIAKEYAARCPDRIQYRTHPDHENRGMSASRNLGIRATDGPLLAFLDADDVWLPRRLEAHVNLLTSMPPVDMVYGPTKFWYSWTGREADRDRDYSPPLGLPVREPIDPPTILRRFLETGGHILPGTCSLLVRRSTVEAVGGFEEEFRGSYEDQVFLAKITAHHRVAVTDECLDLYRQHPDSWCAAAAKAGEYDPEGNPHPAQERYLRWLQDYLQTQEVTDVDLWAALNQRLWPYRYPWQYRITQAARQTVWYGRMKVHGVLRTLLPRSTRERIEQYLPDPS